MKTAPTNDNYLNINHDSKINKTQPLGYINIQGNNNIVVKIDWVFFATLLLLIGTFIFNR
ncbi:MAG: hypothetical protein J6N49_03215 [Alphaproteobacteria bacterium]|nr:hypothetical protein [Alphaproteobacteria bacterium]